MYRWVDHTAELELEIEGASKREVLAEALRALAELLLEGERAGTELRSVAVGASDGPALLAGWLEELLFLAESEGFVATSLEELELGEEGLEATVAGRRADPPPLVKAVTYHRLTFAPGEHGHVATVVLDV